MTFRRSFSLEDERKVRNKSLVLTLALVCVIVFANIVWYFIMEPTPEQINIINVKMLNENQFIVNNDTTNFDGFASLLKKAVIEAKKNHKKNKIMLSVPISGTSSDISDIIMVVTAMDLDWQIKN